jgi:hypothetical protein
MKKIIEDYHDANPEENILLNEGVNLMQPPSRPACGTWGVDL